MKGMVVMASYKETMWLLMIAKGAAWRGDERPNIYEGGFPADYDETVRIARLIQSCGYILDEERCADPAVQTGYEFAGTFTSETRYEYFEGTLALRSGTSAPVTVRWGAVLGENMSLPEVVKMLSAGPVTLSDAVDRLIERIDRIGGHGDRNFSLGRGF